MDNFKQKVVGKSWSWLRGFSAGFHSPDAMDTSWVLSLLSQPSSGPLSWIFAALVFAASVGGLTTFPMGLAAFSWLVLTGGVFLDLSRKAHAFWMGLGVLLDVSLVLVLQVSRNAVQTAVSPGLTDIQMMHIGSSLGAVLFYMPAVYIGLKVLRFDRATGDRSGLKRSRQVHQWVGRFAYLLRSIGFFMMFSMLGRN